MNVLLRSPTFTQPRKPPTAVVLARDADGTTWTTALEVQGADPAIRETRHYRDSGEALSDYYARAQQWAESTASLIRDGRNAEVGL